MDTSKVKETAKELHKQFKKGKTRHVNVDRIDEIHSVDLIEMEPVIGKEHKKYKYILTCIDVFSKYAWAIPLQNKNKESISEALQEIWKERKPEKIWSDHESAIYSKQMQKIFEAYEILLYSTYSEKKAVVIERFNRTLKEKMELLNTEHELEGKKFNWLKHYENIIKEYNNTKHHTIKTTPIEASKKENENKIFKKVYLKINNDIKEDSIPRFKIGQRVRIWKYKDIFTKGYKPRWTTEIFTISQINLLSEQPTYETVDEKGEEITGNFYNWELQATSQ